MKAVRRFLTVATLLFTLTAAAYAGQIDTPPAPPTSPGQMDTTLTATGQIDTPPAPNTNTTSDMTTTESLTEIVLGAYQMMSLSL